MLVGLFHFTHTHIVCLVLDNDPCFHVLICLQYLIGFILEVPYAGKQSIFVMLSQLQFILNIIERLLFISQKIFM